MIRIAGVLVLMRLFMWQSADAQHLLRSGSFKHYIDSFNKNDNELYKGYIPNNSSWDFLSKNIPLLDCPDSIMMQTYYFRWWTYRKHIVKTPDGYIISEFLPDVEWAGKYNGISCPAAFHFYEGRWLHDQQYLDQYAAYWFGGGGEPRRYSFWAADAIYNYCLATGDFSVAKKLLPDLEENFEGWERSNLDPNGLFWQIDDRDGMEVSICGIDHKGIGYRATINSYMYGDARAIASIARLAGAPATAETYERKASALKKILQEKLWDKSAGFFKVLPRGDNATLCSARELHGYTPWYFNMPDKQYATAWRYLMDSAYFYADFGPTSAERGHPDFRIAYSGHECQWNGPSWPYATSVTLTALSNLLQSTQQDYITRDDYFKLLSVYANSHQRLLEDGRTVPWIDENLNPFTGDWISRTRLEKWDNGHWSTGKGGVERGKDYNHSTFCDLVISGLIGVQPQQGNTLVVSPLVPQHSWDWFCLDNVQYHGKNITVMYDKTGKKYGKGKGMKVFVNGRQVAKASRISKLTVTLQD